MITVFFGLLIAAGLIAYSVFGQSVSAKIFDTYAILLVLGGSVSAGLLSVTWKNLKEMFKALKGTCLKGNTDSEAILEELVAITDKAFSAKKLSSIHHDSDNPFIQKGLRLLQSEMGPQEVRKILAEVLLSEKNMIKANADILKGLAKYPPSFGMIGTILGLIGLLEEMSMAAGMDKIGVQMAMALVTTLYGLLVSNYVILPLSEMMVNKYHTELKLKKTILEVFIMIAANKNDPVMIKEFLGVLEGQPAAPAFNEAVEEEAA